MGRWTLRLAAILLLLAATVLARFWAEVSDLPFNEQGRYFDQAAGVVHHEQSATVYGALAIMLAILGLTTMLATMRQR